MSSPLFWSFKQSHQICWIHQKQSYKPVVTVYLWASHSHCLLSYYTVLHSKPVSSSSTFQQRHEADSWSWVANYVRLSPLQAQLWSNGMKKQDQTARLKIILPFRSLLFAASLCLFVSVTSSPSIPPSCRSLYIHFLVSLCFPCSSLRRRRSRGICKKFTAEEASSCIAYCWACVSAPVVLWVPSGISKGSLRQSP